jgi:hypothetical protein
MLIKKRNIFLLVDAKCMSYCRTWWLETTITFCKIEMVCYFFHQHYLIDIAFSASSDLMFLSGADAFS